MTESEIININKIVSHYGKNIICMQSCEELAELIQEISKQWREYHTTKCGLAEEIADVTIILAEIKTLFEIPDGLVDACVTKKIERQVIRMEG